MRPAARSLTAKGSLCCVILTRMIERVIRGMWRPGVEKFQHTLCDTHGSLIGRPIE